MINERIFLERIALYRLYNFDCRYFLSLCKRRTGWTTKSSEFLAKDSLKIAGSMFYLGLFMALGGNFIGILIPKSFTDGVGISEHLYHIIALAGDIPAGILFCLCNDVSAKRV